MHLPPYSGNLPLPKVVCSRKALENNTEVKLGKLAYASQFPGSLAQVDLGTPEFSVRSLTD